MILDTRLISVGFMILNFKVSPQPFPSLKVNVYSPKSSVEIMTDKPTESNPVSVLLSRVLPEVTEETVQVKGSFAPSILMSTTVSKESLHSAPAKVIDARGLYAS